MTVSAEKQSTMRVISNPPACGCYSKGMKTAPVSPNDKKKIANEKGAKL